MCSQLTFFFLGGSHYFPYLWTALFTEALHSKCYIFSDTKSFADSTNTTYLYGFVQELSHGLIPGTIAASGCNVWGKSQHFSFSIGPLQGTQNLTACEEENVVECQVHTDWGGCLNASCSRYILTLNLRFSNSEVLDMQIKSCML